MNNSEQNAELLPSASIAQSNMLAEEGDLENQSPYCQLCESCGNEGCCNFLKCFSKLIKNDKCDNGEVYLKDARFHFQISELADEVFDKLKNGEYNATLAIEAYKKEWHEIYDKVYKTDD